MSKNTEETILDGCFQLFLKNHFELVSIKDMEIHLGMSRGVIFYHHRDKLTLFRNVIEKFITKQLQIFTKIDPARITDDLTLSAFIDLYIEGLENKVEELKNLLPEEAVEDKNNVERSFLELNLYAGHFLPKFNQKVTESFRFETEIWKQVINNAIERKEIKAIDPETLTEQFRTMYLGMIVEKSFENGIDFNQLRTLYTGLYTLVKN